MIVAVLVVATTPPVTTPVDSPTVAIPVALLLHVPPPVPSVSVVVNPEHTVRVPLIAVGNGFTVTMAVCIQPVASVYVIVAVPPDPPVTMPVEPTVALPVLLHVPPLVASVSAVVSPTHTFIVPVIAAGSGFTVTGVTV